MRVKIEEVGLGQHPSEKIVSVQTTDGPEQLVVDERSIREQSLDVGFPVGEHNGHLLVELPRETSRGAWRVWVAKGIVVAS
jgi:hypothetical protein